MTLDLVNRIWVDDDGVSYPVTNAFDSWGDETDETGEAEAIVIAMPDGRFGVVDLREFSRATIH